MQPGLDRDNPQECRRITIMGVAAIRVVARLTKKLGLLLLYLWWINLRYYETPDMFR